MPPSGLVILSGTAELSMTVFWKTTVMVAICACWTMVTLPVFGGTVNVTSSPTVLVPKLCTCEAGSALATTGRVHCAGGHAAIGTQASFNVAQQA
jgi:hypothetical protein